ncbi:hypothetical protein EVA_05349 [gut metagenome]|uniref:Uncharacterized protein n=1 Tax=gut metagenome TaxID=749906 RepID=J9D1U8_9ZZZZ
MNIKTRCAPDERGNLEEVASFLIVQRICWANDAKGLKSRTIILEPWTIGLPNERTERINCTRIFLKNRIRAVRK